MPEYGFNKAEELLLQLKAYFTTEIELAKLTAADKFSKLVSNLIAIVLAATVLLLFILFASISLAFFIGELMYKTWAGFLIVGAFYLLIGIIIWITRGKFITNPIMNSIIRQLFDKDKQETDED